MVAQSGPVFVADDLAPPPSAPSESSSGDSVASADLDDLTVDIDEMGVPSQEEVPLPPAFEDYIPVFTMGGASLAASGPRTVVAPELVLPRSITSLGYLRYTGEEFQWEEIDTPVDLGTDISTMLNDLFPTYKMESGNPGWNTATIRGIDDKLQTFSWAADKPPTERPSDVVPVPQPTAFAESAPLQDWSLITPFDVQEQFVTRGSIAALGRSVYTHGWHYLYQPYRGPAPANLTFLEGSTLIRWPCLLRYEIDGGWSKVWTPLKNDGSVASEARPDPNVLLVGADQTLYSVTEPKNDEPRRLLTFSGATSADIGSIVPPGDLVLYQNKPYLIPARPDKPGLLDIGSGEVLGFETLPSQLVEISGEVVDVTGTEAIILGMEGAYQGEPLNSANRLTYTARPRIDLNYSIAPGNPVATDGEDLWAVIQIEIFVHEPTFEKAYTEPPVASGTRAVFARYDGERWHILPHGLRAALYDDDIGAPGAGVIAAHYEGLPPQVNRYSVISVDTNPFGTNP
jgi:hypothetical protein